MARRLAGKSTESTSTMKRRPFVVGALMLCSTVAVGADAANTAEKSLRESAENRFVLVGTEARPRGPFMAWRGQDPDTGFIRAELWIGAETGPVELFVWSSSGEQGRAKGFLVPMPPAAKSLGFAQIFVASEELFGRGPVAAAILSDGTLRIYPLQGLIVTKNLDLKPQSGAGL